MMKLSLFKKAALAALPIAASMSTLTAAQDNQCAPEPAAPCYEETCNPCYCLGPENYGVNAAVRPRTCCGDFMITVAGLYWIAHQDGMEYAVQTNVTNTNSAGMRNLIDAKYLNPDFDWNWGFKAGLTYNTTCDGWDVGVVWTRYRGKASSHDEAETDDNQTLLPLWSALQPPNAPLFATDIEANWDLDLDLIDFELGREFWNSRLLTLRPFIGVRVALIRQDYDLKFKGGSWSTAGVSGTPVNGLVDLDNDFKGAGLRAGLDSVWNFGCGWAIYGDFAANIIYGKFDFDHDEYNRQAAAPFSKSKVLETENHFRTSRFIGDLALGVQYSALFCDCKYGFSAQLGWEQHIFLDQNQMWRVVRIGSVGDMPNSGENVFHQRRGDLDTAGVSLTLKFSW